MSHIITQIENKPAIVPVTLWPGETVYCPADDADDAAALIKGERGYEPGPNEPEVKRILDLGANVGEFAVWARLRWPYAWVTCYEPDDAKRAICQLNVPPGTRVIDSLGLAAEHYDLVRISGDQHDQHQVLSLLGPHLKLLFLDGQTGIVHPAFRMLACGMRAKHLPFQWWART